MSDRDKEIARELLNEFFGGSKPTSSREDFQILTDLVGTAFFVATADYSAKVVAENSPEPVYLYKYAHQGSFSLTDLTILKPWQLLTKVRLDTNNAALFNTYIGLRLLVAGLVWIYSKIREESPMWTRSCSCLDNPLCHWPLLLPRKTSKLGTTW